MVRDKWPNGYVLLTIRYLRYRFAKTILIKGVCHIPYVTNRMSHTGVYRMWHFVCPYEMYSEMLWIRSFALKKSVSWYTITIAVRIPQTVNDVNNQLNSRLTVQHWPVLDQISIVYDLNNIGDDKFWQTVL